MDNSWKEDTNKGGLSYKEEGNHGAKTSPHNYLLVSVLEASVFICQTLSTCGTVVSLVGTCRTETFLGNWPLGEGAGRCYRCVGNDRDGISTCYQPLS